MSRRNDHTREQLREMVIVAARALVQSEGREGLSARRLAERIGYTVGTLYNIFYNLDDIIMHVNGQTLDEIYQRLRPIPVQYTRPNRILIELAREYARYARENFALWSLVFHQTPTQRLPDWYQDKFKRIFALVENVVVALSGETKKEDAISAAHVLWAGLHGICALSLNGKLPLNTGRNQEELCESLVMHFLEGYLARAQNLVAA